MTLTRILGPAVGGGAVLGAAVLGYSLWEAQRFTLRRVAVPLLPAGHRLLKVLHISDLHVTPSQHAKIEWVRRLRELEPDLVVNTGDNFAHADAAPVVLDALGELLDRPGVFVFGSNDYYSPIMRNPLRYLLPDNGKRYTDQAQLPWGDLQKGFLGRGWLELTNRLGALTVGGTSFAFAGVDDPHLRYDDLELVEGPAAPDADVRIGVAHAPYLRVLDQFARVMGNDEEIIARATPHARGPGLHSRLRGFSATATSTAPGGAGSTVNICSRVAPGDPRSARADTSLQASAPAHARVRFAAGCCEATLLTLTPRSQLGTSASFGLSREGDGGEARPPRSTGCGSLVSRAASPQPRDDGAEEVEADSPGSAIGSRRDKDANVLAGRDRV